MTNTINYYRSSTNEWVYEADYSFVGITSNYRYSHKFKIVARILFYFGFKKFIKELRNEYNSN